MSGHVLGDDSVCFDVMPVDLQLSVMCHWHTPGCYFLLCSEADLPLLLSGSTESPQHVSSTFFLKIITEIKHKTKKIFTGNSWPSMTISEDTSGSWATVWRPCFISCRCGIKGGAVVPRHWEEWRENPTGSPNTGPEASLLEVLFQWGTEGIWGRLKNTKASRRYIQSDLKTIAWLHDL